MTASRIGYELPDGTIVSAYCALDGCIEFNGRILVESYQDPDDVHALVDGGRMWSIETALTWDSRKLKNECGDYLADENDDYVHSHTREPQPLYDTERGDPLSVERGSFAAFCSGSEGEEFVYLFDRNEQWQAWRLERPEGGHENATPVATPVAIPGYTV